MALQNPPTNNRRRSDKIVPFFANWTVKEAFNTRKQQIEDCFATRLFIDPDEADSLLLELAEIEFAEEKL